MPSKTFVMVLKKVPDHFKITVMFIYSYVFKKVRPFVLKHILVQSPGLHVPLLLIANELYTV